MEYALTHYTRGPASRGKARQLVVLLHGLGANGMDLLSLAPQWERALPDAVFAAPDAPFACDMAPVGFQWFSLQDRAPDLMMQGAQAAAPILNEYLDQLLQAYGLEDKDMVLAGFSQGALMSLYVGPRRAQKIAGILAYSGWLVGGEGLDDPAIHRPPVHLIHGEVDDIVPVTAWQAAHDTLTSHGFDVSGHTTPGLPHGIDQKGIESGLSFLSKVFA